MSERLLIKSILCAHSVDQFEAITESDSPSAVAKRESSKKKRKKKGRKVKTEKLDISKFKESEIDFKVGRKYLTVTTPNGVRRLLIDEHSKSLMSRK